MSLQLGPGMGVTRVGRRSLVIDACVARSCGDGCNAAAACTRFLDAVLASGLRMVMTTPLQEEWAEHANGYALSWLYAMETRRRLDRIKCRQNPRLRKSMKRIARDPGVLGIVMKDVFLVEAALQTDKTVASLDDEARYHFAHISHYIGVLARVIWVNPATQSDSVITWVQQGAARDRKWMLGARAKRMHVSGKHATERLTGAPPY